MTTNCLLKALGKQQSFSSVRSVLKCYLDVQSKFFQNRQGKLLWGEAVIFDYLTQKNQVESFEEYFKAGIEEKAKKEAEKRILYL